MPVDEFTCKVIRQTVAKGQRCRGDGADRPERRDRVRDESAFRKLQQDVRRWDELVRCERIAGKAALTATAIAEFIELARTYCPDRVEIFRRALAILSGAGQAQAFNDADDHAVVLDHRREIQRDKPESTTGPPRRPRNGEPRVEARGSSRIECRVGGIHHPENPEVCQRDFARRAKARPACRGWPLAAHRAAESTRRFCATRRLGLLEPALRSPRVEKPP